MEGCHSCKAPQCDWTMVRCTKGKDCRELFCFTCLSKQYPWLYSNIFRQIVWQCPCCLEICKCESCSDPVQKEERAKIARAKYQEEQDYIAAHKEELQNAMMLASAKERLVPPAVTRVRRERLEPPAPGPVDNDDSWTCPKCSVLNIADDIECTACYFHKKRTSRKRSKYSEEAPVTYEDKHDKKEPQPKRCNVAKESMYQLMYDDSFPPAKGRVSALRQLVKKPWTDGWDLARHLALDLVEEARQHAIKQGIPVSQVRQLPTKFMLGNNRATHVRRWFDREPTLAKKFLRAAGLICSKSNGTFIKEHFRSIDDLPPLIKAADLSRCDDEGSGDEGDEPLSASSSPSLVHSSNSTPSESGSPIEGYQPKLKVYYHSTNAKEPFVFKVPVTDLKSMDEFHNRLNVLLREMGQLTSNDLKKLVLSAGAQAGGAYLSDDLSESSLTALSQRPLIHVYAQ